MGLSHFKQSLGWAGLPDTDRAAYFPERTMKGWYELLCCPSAMGCTILEFDPQDVDNSKPVYSIQMRLSHSEYVPRYQLHVMKDGKTKPWIVGNMVKTETTLRAKPGEFVRVQIWSVTSNSVVWEVRRTALHRNSQPCYSAVKDRPTPSAEDMQTRGLAIATQAKLDMTTSEDGELLDMETERWVQTIGIDSRAYKVAVESPRGPDAMHRTMDSMSVLHILHKGQKVCVARKQCFAGSPGSILQPYLGIQIRPPLEELQRREDEADGVEEGRDDPKYIKSSKSGKGVENLKSLMSTSSVMLLLMCLAWSEETMSPQLDMTDRFVQTMRANTGERDSAADRGLSEQWDTDVVRMRLRQYGYAKLHSWAKTGPVAEDPPPVVERPPKRPPKGAPEAEYNSERQSAPEDRDAA